MYVFFMVSNADSFRMPESLSKNTCMIIYCKFHFLHVPVDDSVLIFSPDETANLKLKILRR